MVVVLGNGKWGRGGAEGDKGKEKGGLIIKISLCDEKFSLALKYTTVGRHKLYILGYIYSFILNTASTRLRQVY